MSYGQDVEETKEWDRFWGSGKVEDYLRYKSCHQEQETEKSGTYRQTQDRKYSEDVDRFT